MTTRFYVTAIEDGAAKKFGPYTEAQAQEMRAGMIEDGDFSSIAIVEETPAYYRGPKGPKKITSRFQSTCPGCGTINVAGSTVYWSRETGAFCPRCGLSHYRTLGRGRIAR